MNVTGRKDNVHTNQVVCQVESFLQNTLSKSGRLLFGISEDVSEDSVFRVERIYSVRKYTEAARMITAYRNGAEYKNAGIRDVG